MFSLKKSKNNGGFVISDKHCAVLTVQTLSYDSGGFFLVASVRLIVAILSSFGFLMFPNHRDLVQPKSL